MKKIVIIFSVFITLAGFHIASAHTTITDGDISVLLHTNPDDDPIVGQPASMLFEVTDAKNKFDINNCNCNITVSEGGKQLLSGPLYHLDTGNSVYSLTMPFTFPKKDVYTIDVSGSPKTGSAFQNFEVQYNLRVDRSSTNSSTKNSNKYLWIGVGTVAVLGGLGAVYLIRMHKK